MYFLKNFDDKVIISIEKGSENSPPLYIIIKRR